MRRNFSWQCCGSGVGNILARITWRRLEQSFRTSVKSWDLETQNILTHGKKVLKWKSRKNDKQMPRTERVKGIFPMNLSFTGKLSLLLPWVSDPNLIQKLEKVRPRTARHRLESGTWNECCCLPSHTPPCPTSLPSTLSLSGSSPAFWSTSCFTFSKRKVQTHSFGMRKLPNHVFHNPKCFPHCDQPRSSVLKVPSLITRYTIFKLLTQASSSSNLNKIFAVAVV